MTRPNMPCSIMILGTILAQLWIVLVVIYLQVRRLVKLSDYDQILTGSDFDCLPPELVRSSPNGPTIFKLFLINISLIGFIGILGNLATVCTIVDAKRNHKEEFRIFSHSSTPLLIHLAICDILYCAGMS